MKPTSAQMTILHLLLSTLVSGIFGLLSTGMQYYYDHGQNLWVAIVFVGTSFPVAFATMRLAALHAIQSSPALPQAEKDTESQALQLAQAALAKVESLASNVMPFVHSHPAPPAPATTQGRVSNAVATRAPQPIIMPQASGQPAIHFGDTANVPAVTPPNV